MMSTANLVAGVLVDFNAETPEGRFFVLLDRFDSPVACNTAIQAYDADGDQMITWIDEINQDRGVVYLRPIWSTWIDGDD